MEYENIVKNNSNKISVCQKNTSRTTISSTMEYSAKWTIETKIEKLEWTRMSGYLFSMRYRLMREAWIISRKCSMCGEK